MQIIDLIHYPQVLAGYKGRAPDVNCQMACCAMSSVLGAIAQPPNGQLVNGSFGNLVVETSTVHIVQQAIQQLTFAWFPSCRVSRLSIPPVRPFVRALA